jgi:cardiolipin synthase
VNETYFPQTPHEADQAGSDLIQIVAGGPIFRLPTIMLTYAKIINDARSRIFITNPYFIPNESILNTLMQASLSGVDVRLLLPGKSDSQLVAAASKFYIRGLLEAGVRVYFYQKGFIHAKTLVADGYIGVVGTANMDIRSFDLNYEIMAVSYSKSLGNELEETFYSDLKDSIEVTLLEWRKKPLITRLVYAIARLVSSLL